MGTGLKPILKVGTGNRAIAVLLLWQSVFTGFFYGTFDISVHALFLEVFDETILARAYVVSALAGILLLTVGYLVQARIKYRAFAVLNMLTVSTLVLVLWALMKLAVSPSVIFLLFVMMGPLNILAIAGLRKTAKLLAESGNGRNLPGIADTGLMAGIIAGSLATLLLLAVGVSLPDVILISAVALFFSALSQFRVGMMQNTGETAFKENGSFTASDLLKWDPYPAYICLFFTISIVATFFVQYTFMALTRVIYPSAVEMAMFLGIFTGVMMTFALIVRKYIFTHIVSNYGVKLLLFIPPLTIMVAATVAAVSGTVIGNSAKSGGIILLFILVAISRLLSRAVGDSIEIPTTRILFQTLAGKVKSDFNFPLTLMVNEGAVFLSGLLLSVLGLFFFTNLIGFLWALLAITALWLYVGFRLHTEYRKSIVRLPEMAFPDSEEETPAESIPEYPGRLQSTIILRSNYPALINHDFSIMEGRLGEAIAGVLVEIALVSNDPNLTGVLKWINANGRFTDAIRQQALKAQKLSDIKRIRYSDPFIPGEVRAEILELITADRAPQPTQLLKLFRDRSAVSGRTALMLVARHEIADMMQEVCQLLTVTGTAIDATSVLNHFGERSCGELHRFFMKSSGNTLLAKSLLSVMSSRCYPESKNLIYQMLRSSSKVIKGRAVAALTDHGFRLPDEERERGLELISVTISTIRWYIPALAITGRARNNELTEALYSEMNWWYDFLFKLLALTYDSRYIDKIRRYLESGTDEGVALAIETANVVFDEEIRQQFAYCIEGAVRTISTDTLPTSYNDLPPSYEELVLEVINRDYNLTDLWTKAVAVRSLGSLKTDNIRMTISALLFSPSRLLVEEAYLLVNNIHDYEEVLGRIPPVNREIVSEIAGKEMNNYNHLYYKTRFLKGRLKAVPVDDIIPLAGKLVYSDSLPVSEEKPVSGVYVMPLEVKDLAGRPCYRLSESDAVNYLSYNLEYLKEVTGFLDKL